MTPEQKLAFNVALYRKKDPRRLARDGAAFALEAGIDAVTAVEYEIKDDDVIAPDFGPLSSCLSYGNEIERQESEATLKIIEILSKKKSSYVWLSPPDENVGYPEGRIAVGFVEGYDHQQIVRNYFINHPPFSAEEFLEIYNRLSLEMGEEACSSADEIRGQPLLIEIPDSENVFDFLERYIPLPESWQKIKSGRADEENQKALAASREIALRKQELINRTNDFWGLVYIGASYEQEMRRVCPEWLQRASTTCGITNGQLLDGKTLVMASYQLDGGELKLTGVEVGYFCTFCPHCGEAINKVIHPGYKCKCGKVYC